MSLYLNPIRTEAVSPRRRATINACHINMNERIGLFFLDFSSWVFHQMLIHSVFQYLYKILRNHVRKIGGTLQFWVCSQIWCCLRTNLGQIGPNFWSGRPNFWNLTQWLFSIAIRFLWHKYEVCGSKTKRLGQTAKFGPNWSKFWPWYAKFWKSNPMVVNQQQ